jgi:MFS family permease
VPEAAPEKFVHSRDVAFPSGLMAKSRSPAATDRGTVASSISSALGRASADPRSLLWLNNALSIISNIAWCIATPFIPLYLASQGASVVLVGVVVGISGILPLLLSIHAGALVDERGPTMVAKGSVVLFALAGAVLTGVHGVWAVAVAYTLMGIANIGFAVAPQAIVAAASDPAARIQNYGYYFLWTSAGAVIGPVMGGLVAGRFGYTAAFALVWLLMLPAFGIAASLRVSGVPRHAVSLATAHTLAGTIVRQPGIGVVLFIAFMVGCGQALQQSFYPLYLHKVGLSTTMIGIVVAAVSLSSMLVRSLLARGVALFGYMRLLLGATALAAIALGVTPLMRRFWPLVLASGLMGASTGFTQPLTMNLMVEAVAEEFWGVAFGIRQSVQRLASVVSPIVFGVVITAYGIESAFFLGSLTLAGALPIMARVTGHLRCRTGGKGTPRTHPTGGGGEGRLRRASCTSESDS